MNIFIFSGGDSESSKTNYYMKWLCKRLCNEGNIVFFRSLFDDILSGKLKKNRLAIENEIIGSDIVIFCCPVHLHNVSSTTKEFLDLFVEWSHTLRLTGILGVVVTVSSSNGNQSVNKYLHKVLNYFGVTVLGNLSINHTMEEEKVKNKLYDFVNLAKDLDKSQIKVEKRQDEIFLLYKEWYETNRNFTESERKSLENIGINVAKDFQELFNLNLKSYRYIKKLD
ncbi:flavodoxin family protein [Atopobacter sp. AH10]|uniref:flavodoxin family protein n=1 Tax=Atopobacter sp. AH10 TaxID=2315861 RepID=UPI000EF204EE|nr:NAD(P)H-dependent oxidoreductase [Atopobacter sp. AH10]RLK63100.1 flavodoxin family protein [Atopobacter sp. AH10]